MKAWRSYCSRAKAMIQLANERGSKPVRERLINLRSAQEYLKWAIEQLEQAEAAGQESSVVTEEF